MTRFVIASLLATACSHPTAPPTIAKPATPVAEPIVGSPATAAASIDAFCKDAAGDLGGFFTCNRPGDEIAAAFKPAPPYLAAQLFWSGSSDTVPSNACHLAVQTPAGWQVARVSGDCFGNGKYQRRMTVEELAVKDIIPGGQPELMLRFQIESSDPIDDGEFHGRESGTQTYVVVCGSDADGALSCTEDILVGSKLSDDGGRERSWALELQVRPNGRVEFRAAPGGAKLPEDAEKLVGVHDLQL